MPIVRVGYVPPRGTPAQRGYGQAHRALRRQLAARVTAGLVRCARGAACLQAEYLDGRLVGGLIAPGQAWDLDHSDDRRGYLGPSHARCNRSSSCREAGA